MTTISHRISNRIAQRIAAPAQIPAAATAGQIDQSAFAGYSIAAIVPCYNEEIAIAKVVTDLRTAVPSMTVYVYDNASTDNTAAVAAAAGAVVRHEHLKGKGNVVRRAFADIDADIYLMIDGDDTYDAAAAPAMIAKLLEGPYDHVLGVREEAQPGTGAYRPNHAAGNKFLNAVVAGVFGDNVGDMLSGYRVFSRRFVKSFPATSREFEIETELTVHCLALRIPQTSLSVGFKDRPEGSESKLRTYHDGRKILGVIASLTRHERPLACAALAALATLGVATGTALTGLGTLAIALTMTALICGLTGLVLDTARKNRHETSRQHYLTLAPVTPTKTTTTTPVPARTIPAPVSTPVAAPVAAPIKAPVYVAATPDYTGGALNRIVTTSTRLTRTTARTTTRALLPQA